MKRTKRFLATKSNWTSIAMVVLSIIGVVISFLLEQFFYQIIGAMFALIAVENFVKQFTYMEDIKEKLNSLKPQGSSYVEIKARRQCKDIPTVIGEAKHELFISGINMRTLGGYTDEILSRNDLNIRILVLNLNNAELRNAHENMKGHHIKGMPTAYYFLEEFKNHDYIKIKEIDSITPIMFVAYDMEKPYGYIKAEHHFNGTELQNLPNIELTPDKDWYESYREQIETLWERGRDYVFPEKDEQDMM